MGVFQMRVTDEEKARWKARAAAAGLTIAAWIKARCADAETPAAQKTGEDE